MNHEPLVWNGRLDDAHAPEPEMAAVAGYAQTENGPLPVARLLDRPERELGSPARAGLSLAGL